MLSLSGGLFVGSGGGDLVEPGNGSVKTGDGGGLAKPGDGSVKTGDGGGLVTITRSLSV